MRVLGVKRACMWTGSGAMRENATPGARGRKRLQGIFFGLILSEFVTVLCDLPEPPDPAEINIEIHDMTR